MWDAAAEGKLWLLCYKEPFQTQMCKSRELKYPSTLGGIEMRVPSHTKLLWSTPDHCDANTNTGILWCSCTAAQPTKPTLSFWHCICLGLTGTASSPMHLVRFVV